jgi:hypothetical protein
MSYWTRWPLRKDGPTQSPETDSDGARQSRQLSEFTAQLPDDPNKPGYKKSPIPMYEGTVGPVDRTGYKMGTVNLADLKTRQPYVEGKRIQEFHERDLPSGDMKHPLVIITRDNQQVVDNGNHRVARMIGLGQKTTPARIVHEIHGYGGQGPGSLP